MIFTASVLIPPASPLFVLFLSLFIPLLRSLLSSGPPLQLHFTPPLIDYHCTLLLQQHTLPPPSGVSSLSLSLLYNLTLFTEFVPHPHIHTFLLCLLPSGSSCKLFTLTPFHPPPLSPCTQPSLSSHPLLIFLSSLHHVISFHPMQTYGLFSSFHSPFLPCFPSHPCFLYLFFHLSSALELKIKCQHIFTINHIRKPNTASMIRTESLTVMLAEVELSCKASRGHQLKSTVAATAVMNTVSN